MAWAGLQKGREVYHAPSAHKTRAGAQYRLATANLHQLGEHITTKKKRRGWKRLGECPVADTPSIGLKAPLGCGQEGIAMSIERHVTAIFPAALLEVPVVPAATLVAKATVIERQYRRLVYREPKRLNVGGSPAARLTRNDGHCHDWPDCHQSPRLKATA
ncbi:MAG: hypothetical protein IT483_15940 [Gammaproteobacteria bacterium]|nr:hypothetical protein [Gammaproteobacteria bacterium]